MTELSFRDGSAPSQDIVDKWLSLVNTEFNSNADTCIGVHCVTGLGRAPVLVATALIELGMKYEVMITEEETIEIYEYFEGKMPRESGVTKQCISTLLETFW